MTAHAMIENENPTTASPSTTPAGPPARRRSGRARFLVAFLVGLIASLAIGVGAIYAFDRQFEGRILTGVSVGSVDLSGLDQEAARDRLEAAYRGAGDGRIVIEVGARRLTLDYASFGRRVEVEPIVAHAYSIGREGNLLDRAISEARTALNGVVLTPSIGYDRAALAAAIDRLLDPLDEDPEDASVRGSDDGFATTAARFGQRVDRAAVIDAVEARIASLDAPAEIAIPVEPELVRPAISDVDAMIVRTMAERMSQPITLRDGEDTWTIKQATVRSWIGFATTDGHYGPVVDPTKVTAALKGIAKTVSRPATNATFLLGKDGAIVGVSAGKNGRALDQPATTTRIVEAIEARAAGQTGVVIAAALKKTEPKLTTAEAEQAAPLMKRISTWTTYFPIGEKNGFGANIWIPAKLINGTVVAPGETFDFWKAVGSVTREKGYKQGGAIIDGRTEPQGALAGGICSCSTTLFNAALRAGFKMGARRNHFYYIDRYPLGLDATVFISASGATQTMSWTNDTGSPVLIRGINTRSGNRGFVRFDIYSVPTGRKVTFSTPIVKNRKPATTITQETTTLPAGQKEQIEYPVEGKDVWVTRTVRDKSGKVIHQDTYYSHYARITGIILVGTGAAASSNSKP